MLKDLRLTPVSMETSSQDVIDSLENFLSRREFIEGREFILSIADSVARLPDMAIICANFYLEAGNPKWAEESLEKANIEKLLSEDGALLDERIACMALLSAHVKKFRYCDFESALAIVLKLEEFYVHLNFESLSEAVSKSKGTKIDHIKRQSHLWTTQSAEDYDDSEAPISDFRVYIELWIFEIFFGQAEGLLMRDKDIDERLRVRIPPLIKFLRSRGRRAIEGHCLFITDIHRYLPDPFQAASFLQEYLDSLNDEKHILYKAGATCRLSQYVAISNPEAARLYLDESQSLFASQNCANHLLDIDFIRIRDFQRTTHSASNRLDQLCALANQYRSCQNLRMQLRTVRFALDIVTQEMWGKVETILAEVEADLSTAGDEFKLLVTRVVKLRALSQNSQDSDEARAYLEGYLFDHPEYLTPDLYACVCQILSQCYYALEDFDLAVKFAEMESKSQAALEFPSRMSDAIYHLVNARRFHIGRSIGLLDRSANSQRQLLVDSLTAAARELEAWAEWDKNNARTVPFSSKSVLLFLIYGDLDRKFCPNQGYSDKYNYWTKENTPSDVLNPSQVSLSSIASALLMFIARNQYKEGFEFAEKAMVDFSTDSTRSDLDMVIARFLVISSMQGAYATIKAESIETAKIWRTKQLKWLLEDTNVLKIQRSSELLLMRVSMLCWVMKDFIEFFPDQRRRCLGIMVEFFNDTDKICHDLRHSLKGGGLSRLIRKRTLVSKFSIRSFYEHAAQFFLQVRNETNAWFWLQKKRGQALLDMLAERATAYEQLELAFKNDKKIEGLLSKEDSLVEEVVKTDANKYLAAAEQLAEHRDEMKTVPALNGIIDDSTFSSPHAWNNLEDIWFMAQWLPENTNIILIDWFVSPQNVVFWISKDLKRKHLTPEWAQLTIGPVFIDNWIAKYLQFPNDKIKPLERESRAAWKLQYLLAGLDKICKPGDLVILTPPARFASVPIHAIPMGGKPWMVRNTIIYSSSFSLYRECLKRSRRISPPLSNAAVFTMAYEESGYEDEKLDIMKQVESSAAIFGARTIMGAELTSDTLREALCSAPWIHYHGHAYYERSEALKQCFVLSPKIRPQDIASGEPGDEEQVTGGANPIQTTQPTEFDSSFRPKAMLSAHLLKNSSQLAVSEIFALNLSKNHPVVCSIACDSGLQDIAAGDEPLGLVTALFCAGASSVLGTLWPIQSDTARSFTNHFYKSIHKQRQVEEAKDSKVKVLNLALAVREASLEVKKEKGDPYSWAAFVLHGAGFYLYQL